MSEQIQHLIKEYREARTALKKALTEAFPIGSPVYIEEMRCYAKVMCIDGEFVQLLFENGNVWPREPRSLRSCRWDDLSAYWRHALNGDSLNWQPGETGK